MADGTVNIDVILNDKASEKAREIDNTLKQVGGNAGEKIDNQIGQELDKAIQKTETAHDKMQKAVEKPVKQKIEADDEDAKSKTSKILERFKALPTSVKTKLVADAEKIGIENFDKLLKKLPRKQQTELAAQVQKGEVVDYEALLKTVPAKLLTTLELNDNASERLQKLKQEATETETKFSSLKDIIKGTFIGGLAAQGVGMITSALGDLVSQSMQASDAIYKFKSTMKLGGFGEEEIAKSTKEMKKYADQTVYDLSDVSNTTAQLAANGIKNYMKLTEAAGNLNAQAGGSAETFKSVAMVMTQTAGAGKLTTENWNQLADAIPGASGVLQKAMKENGAYTGNFRDAMANGQITAQEFNKAVTQLGMNKGAVEAAKSTETFEGAFGNLEANVIDGLDKMINAVGKKKLTNMINTASDAIVGLTGMVLKLFETMSEHKHIAVALASVLAGLFATKKVTEFIAALGQAKQAMMVFGFASEFASGAGGGIPKNVLTSVPTAGVGLGARVASFAGKAVPVAAAVAGVGSELTSNNNTSQKVGGSIGSVAGTAGGAALGSFLDPFIGPAGTALGAAAGSWIGKKLGEAAGDAAGKALKGKSLVATTKVKVDADTSALNQINKKISPSMKKLNKMLINLDVDPKSIVSARTKSDKLYLDMTKSVDKFYADKEKKSEKNLQNLVKEGVITQKQANQRLAAEKKADQKQAETQKAALTKMQKDTNDHYNRLQTIQNGGTKKLLKIAQKYGTDSERYEKERQKEIRKENKAYLNEYVKDQMNANKSISKTIDVGAAQQKKILEKLNKEKGKLSLQDLERTKKDANKQYEATVKPAKKTRDEVIDAANEKYKKTVKTAESEYKEHHSISKRQYEDIVKKARDQRDDTTSAAEEQYKKVTKKAAKQHADVVKEIDRQKTDVTTAAYQQASAHAAAAGSEYAMVNANVATGSGKTASIWNKLGKGINKVLKVFEASQTVPMLTEAYAVGTGALQRDQLALVGEEGFELAHTPQGYEIMGQSGPELRFLSAGTSILTHEQSKQAMVMNGGKLPGYAKGTGAKIADFVSDAVDTVDTVTDLASDAFDFIGKSALEIWNKLKSGIGLDKLLGNLPKPWLVQDYGKGSIHVAESSVGKFLKKFADKFSDSLDSNSTSPTATGTHMHWLAQVGVPEGWRSDMAWIVSHESSWNPHATNAGSGAYGIPQALPASKLAAAGKDWRDNPITQLKWMLNYIKGRYGTATNAKAFWQSHHWYADGGWSDEPAIFGEVPNEPEAAINPKRSTADGLIAQTIVARAGEDPNSFAGQLVKTAKAGAQNLTAVMAMSHRSGDRVVSERAVSSEINGDMSVNVVLDSATIARATYPTTKALMAHEITIRGAGGAVPVGRAMPVGGGF